MHGLNFALQQWSLYNSRKKQKQKKGNSEKEKGKRTELAPSLPAPTVWSEDEIKKKNQVSVCILARLEQTEANALIDNTASCIAINLRWLKSEQKLRNIGGLSAGTAQRAARSGGRWRDDTHLEGRLGRGATWAGVARNRQAEFHLPVSALAYGAAQQRCGPRRMHRQHGHALKRVTPDKVLLQTAALNVHEHLCRIDS